VSILCIIRAGIHLRPPAATYSDRMCEAREPGHRADGVNAYRRSPPHPPTGHQLVQIALLELQLLLLLLLLLLLSRTLCRTFPFRHLPSPSAHSNDETKSRGTDYVRIPRRNVRAFVRSFRPVIRLKPFTAITRAFPALPVPGTDARGVKSFVTRRTMGLNVVRLGRRNNAPVCVCVCVWRAGT